MIDAIVIGDGQSGLAATHHLSRRGLTVTLIEAAAEPVGCWPHYWTASPCSHPPNTAHYQAFRSPATPTTTLTAAAGCW
jgi:putative flavoprotein involved in K+ transport